MNYSYDFISTIAYISQSQPSNVNNGFLWFNNTNNTLNILVNGNWYNVASSLYSLTNSLNTNVLNELNQVSSSINNYTVQMQAQIQSDSSNVQNFINNINNISNSINTDLNTLSSLINTIQNLTSTDNTLFNNDLTVFDSLSYNVLNNMFLFASVSFQALTGYYVYTFNFENLFNAYSSYFDSGFNVVALVRRPIRYFYDARNSTAYPNVSEGNSNYDYPLMYHVDSDLVYSSSSHIGSFTLAIGPQSSYVSNLNSLSLHDYAQDSSAELYEIKFFAGPFNGNKNVSSNYSYYSGKYTYNNYDRYSSYIFGYYVYMY